MIVPNAQVMMGMKLNLLHDRLRYVHRWDDVITVSVYMCQCRCVRLVCMFLVCVCTHVHTPEMCL